MSMEKQSLLEGIMAASSASSREVSTESSGCVSCSIDERIDGDLGVGVRLRAGRCVVLLSSLESLRGPAFLPVLCVTRYWHVVPLFAHRLH